MEQTNITFPEPIEPGRAGQPVKLDTNAWGIAVQQEGTFYRYWVGVVGQVSAEKRDVDLARTTQDKTLLLDYKLQCLKLMGLVANADSRFNGEEALWYDGQHFLVTPYDIFQKSQKEAFTIIIQKQDLPPECANFSNVQMTFRREGENTVTLSKEKLLAFGQHRGELGNSREVIRLLELASNEFCLANPDMFLCYKNGKVYLPDGKQFGFAREEYPIMPEGTVLLPGSAKSAAFIEGPKGRQNGNIALIVDASKACFHQHEPLLSKYKSMFTADLQLRNFDTNAAQFSSQVRGIFVQTEHLPPAKMFKIIEVVAGQIPSNTRFSYKDREVTVEDYFKERYNIALQHPQLPLVKCRGLRLRSDVFFPPELCKIVANQRVTVQQQTTQLMQQTVKLSAMPPAKRIVDTTRNMAAMQLLNPNNPFVNSLGVKILDKPLTVDGRVMIEPGMRYGRETCKAAEGKWRSPRQTEYVTGGRLDTWALFFLAGVNDRVEESKCMRFAENFVFDCNKRGLKIAQPRFVDLVRLPDQTTSQKNFDLLNQTFLGAKQNNCEFLFTVTCDRVQVHGTVKYLERLHQVPNQDLKLSTAMKIVEGQRNAQTLENVVSKFNVKLGGLNYTLTPIPGHDAAEYMKQDRLILGVAQVSAEGKEQRTVYGYAANPKGNPNEFVGGFTIHKDVDKRPALEAILKSMYNQYKAHHSDRLPSELVVYWAGQSEGEMTRVMTDIVHGGFPDFFSQLRATPRWTFIMAVKRQNNVRIYKQSINPADRPPAQNISAGIVIDTHLTDPVKKQFFLNSHITLQGSAATPCYTVLHDSLNLSMDALETMTFGLAHLHQICTMTTSLPAPLYIATQYAKRGSTLLSEKIKAGGDGPEEELTMDLSYADTLFADRRINA